MAISIASRKAKGKDLQNLVAKKISELLNVPYGQDEEIQSRQMGGAGVDIALSKEIRKLFPFSIEVKNQQQLNLLKTWQQACNNCYEDTNPVIVYKKTGKTKNERIPPLVIIELDVFFNLLGEIINDNYRNK